MKIENHEEIICQISTVETIKNIRVPIEAKINKMIKLNLIALIDIGCTFNIIRKYLVPEDCTEKLEYEIRGKSNGQQ